VYSQDRELAKTLKRRLEAKPPLTLEELLTTLVENCISKKVLVKVQSLSEEQAAPNQPTKRTVSNLSQTQQFNNKIRVSCLQRGA
jgi:hypothetical protein